MPVVYEPSIMFGMTLKAALNRTSNRVIDPDALRALFVAEERRYRDLHPQSSTLAAHTQAHYLRGVPLHWMSDWPVPFPLFVEFAQDAHVIDADGHQYVDFCLGDSGALFGHSPAPVARALTAQATRGFTAMLPSVEAKWVGNELTRRFGLPVWQIATTASDANRFLLRWARAATGRSTIIVFDGCYHGAVDETLVRLHDDRTVAAPGLLGQALDPRLTTRVVEFNHVPALAAALAVGDVAAVLCEPVLTNIGMVLPDANFHAELRALTRQHGTLLIVDETHTLSTGPGGYTQAFALEPDGLVVGKAIAGGIACAVYGMSAAFAARVNVAWAAAPPGRTGIGTTLSGNLLQLAALRATLEEVATDAAFTTMIEGRRLSDAALEASIDRYALPWSITRLGARSEIQFTCIAPRTGREAEAAAQPDLTRALHLFLLNRGILITPFHTMTLVSPVTTQADLTTLVDAFEAFLTLLRTFDPQPPPRV